MTASKEASDESLSESDLSEHRKSDEYALRIAMGEGEQKAYIAVYGDDELRLNANRVELMSTEDKPAGYRELREGDWFQTYTGRMGWAIDPRPEDIFIADIAHALSLICRFGGQCLSFYSVAQHSLFVSELCLPENALVGLLHDASEAYIGDVIRPLKISLPGYHAIEKKWEEAIGKAFRLGSDLVSKPSDVTKADWVALATERRDLLAPGPGHARWNLKYPPSEQVIVPMSSVEVEVKFLERFYRLNEIRNRAHDQEF